MVAADTTRLIGAGAWAGTGPLDAEPRLEPDDLRL